MLASDFLADRNSNEGRSRAADDDKWYYDGADYSASRRRWLSTFSTSGDGHGVRDETSRLYPGEDRDAYEDFQKLVQARAGSRMTLAWARKAPRSISRTVRSKLKHFTTLPCDQYLLVILPEHHWATSWYPLPIFRRTGARPDVRLRRGTRLFLCGLTRVAPGCPCQPGA